MHGKIKDQSSLTLLTHISRACMS